MVEICIEFTHKELHVSALDNILQVEKLKKKKRSKQLYSTYVGGIEWGSKR